MKPIENSPIAFGILYHASRYKDRLESTIVIQLRAVKKDTYFLWIEKQCGGEA